MDQARWSLNWLANYDNTNNNNNNSINDNHNRENYWDSVTVYGADVLAKPLNIDQRQSAALRCTKQITWAASPPVRC